MVAVSYTFYKKHLQNLKENAEQVCMYFALNFRYFIQLDIIG